MTAESSLEGSQQPKFRVRLYVAGSAPNSIAAVANLRAAVAACPDAHVTIEIIDVLITPERALLDGIFVTPMLVRAEPPPERRVLGRLQDRAMLLAALGLEEAPRD